MHANHHAPVSWIKRRSVAWRHPRHWAIAWHAVWQGHRPASAQRINGQYAGMHTPWRQETVRRDQGLPKAETGHPCQAAHASRAEDRPTAARRGQPRAAATQAAAVTSVGQLPVSKQSCQTATQECSRANWASTAAPRAAPPASRAPACTEQARQLQVRDERAKRARHAPEAEKQRPAASHAASFLGCRPARIACQHNAMRLASAEELTLQATAASGVVNSTRA